MLDPHVDGPLRAATNRPARPLPQPEHTAAAQALSREWQYYVARSHSLRKVFFSIKARAAAPAMPLTRLLLTLRSSVLPLTLLPRR